MENFIHGLSGMSAKATALQPAEKLGKPGIPNLEAPAMQGGFIQAFVSERVLALQTDQERVRR